MKYLFLVVGIFAGSVCAQEPPQKIVVPCNDGFGTAHVWKDGRIFYRRGCTPAQLDSRVRTAVTQRITQLYTGSTRTAMTNAQQQRDTQAVIDAAAAQEQMEQRIRTIEDERAASSAPRTR